LWQQHYVAATLLAAALGTRRNTFFSKIEMRFLIEGKVKQQASKQASKQAKPAKSCPS
jgi:hypothetical protein